VLRYLDLVDSRWLSVQISFWPLTREAGTTLPPTEVDLAS